MANCTTCENAIFDALWGEYKCSVYKRVSYSADFKTMLVDGCKDYKNGTPKESKANADYKADLYDC